jgi:hypothetical protein
MQLPPKMQGLKSFKGLSQQIGYNIFGDVFGKLIDKINHGASVHKLDKHE